MICAKHGADDGLKWACPHCHHDAVNENYRLKYLADRMLSLLVACQILHRSIDNDREMFTKTPWFESFYDRPKLRDDQHGLPDGKNPV